MYLLLEALFTNSENFTGSHINGNHACWDCNIALTIMFFILSYQKCCFSVRSLMKGIISLIPISVAFSRNHSKRLEFLMGEIPILTLGPGCGAQDLAVILTSALFLFASISEAVSTSPLPLVKRNCSFSCIRKTCTICFELSSLRMNLSETGKFSSKKKGNCMVE